MRPPVVRPGHSLVLYAAWADCTPLLTGILRTRFFSFLRFYCYIV